jgi:hypothetical protein
MIVFDLAAIETADAINDNHMNFGCKLVTTLLSLSLFF